MWHMITSCEHDSAPLDELSECRHPDYPVMQGCTAELKSIHVLLRRNRLMALLYWIFANGTNIQQNSLQVRVRFDYCVSTTVDLMCVPPWFRLESFAYEIRMWICDWHSSKGDKGISFCILHLAVGFAYFILVKYFICCERTGRSHPPEYSLRRRRLWDRRRKTRQVFLLTRC